MSRTRVPRWVMGLAMLAACGSRGETAHLPSQGRDSLGVAIVDNYAPSWDTTETWHLDSLPRIALPVDAPYMARLRKVTRLSDGRLALLSAAANQIVVFDTLGQVIRTIGRQGGGPGEFRTAERMQRLPGDTLRVWDTAFGPRTTFDSAGHLVDIAQIDLARLDEAIGPANWSEELTPLGDGNFIAHLHERISNQPPSGEIFRPALGFIIVKADYTARPLGWYGGRSMVSIRSGGEQIQVLAPMHQRTSLAVADGPTRIFISDGASREVKVFDGDGRLLQLIRRADAARPLTRQVLSPNHEAFIGAARTNAERKARQAVWNDMPKAMSSITGLQVDSEGYLWVATSGDGWNVFAPEGRWLGRVQLHGVRQIYEIGRDYLIGATEDSLGREHVGEYRLDRRRSPGRRLASR